MVGWQITVKGIRPAVPRPCHLWKIVGKRSLGLPFARAGKILERPL